jgi:hypothetical protein
MLGGLFLFSKFRLIGIKMTGQTVNILCSCGSDKFEIPRNPKASDVIICARCGAQEKYGILQKEIASKVKKKVEADFRKMLRKAGFK